MRAGKARLLALTMVISAALAPAAKGGFGEGYFYSKGPIAIPNGHGAATLKLKSVLPGDIDPKVDYVSISLRVTHPRTRDLVAKLKRPDFDYTGMDPASPERRVVALSKRDTRGAHLGSGGCPTQNPFLAPPGFTTLNDAGGPPIPIAPMTPPSLGTGAAPYGGTYQPRSPLSGFNDYHHAPSTDPASPEKWKLAVRDVRDNGAAGKLRCAVLYLHRL